MGDVNYKSNYDETTWTHANINEFFYIEGCFNAGLMYMNKDYIDVNTSCYCYDYKMFYANILCNEKFNFEIAIKQGTLHNITINTEKYIHTDKFTYGIYNCKLLITNPKAIHHELFKRFIKISPESYYTHYTLNFLLENKKELGVTKLRIS